MRKLKLKEDDDGNKVSDVLGIRAACKVMKTRYAKPFETVQVKIPYSTGMNPTSGLVDMFEAMGVLTKSGNKLQYVSKKTGEIFSEFRKNWTEDKLMIIMTEWDSTSDNITNTTNEVEE
jgi:hypothetical protein